MGMSGLSSINCSHQSKQNRKSIRAYAAKDKSRMSENGTPLFTSQLTHTITGPSLSFWTLFTICRRNTPSRMGFLFCSGGRRAVRHLLQNRASHSMALLLYLHHNPAHCLQNKHSPLERGLHRPSFPPEERAYRATIDR